MLLGCLISLGGLPNPCCLAGCLGMPAAFVAGFVGFNSESRSEAVIGMFLGALTGFASLGFLVLIVAVFAGMVDIGPMIEAMF